MKRQAFATLLALGLALVALATPAQATNGMNMIGTGAVSSGMGGADVAVPAGCTAIAGNPAQLATTCDRVISLGAAFLMPNLNTEVPGLGDEGNQFQLFPLPFIGYAQRLGASRFSLGLGLFAQGGMGVDFDEVPAGPGVTGRLYSRVAFLRFAPTLAYNLTDSLTLGASVFTGYATIDYDFFPNLASGQHVTDLSSFTLAGRVGLSYQINREWALGLTYTSSSALDFSDGEMVVNFGTGLGKVTYRDASMDDFTWPQQVEAGISFRPSQKWLLAFDLTWINWSDAIETVTVTGQDPDTALPAAYQKLEVPFIMNWEDQWVFAFGAQYQVNQNWTVRAGYNYGRSPVPDDTLNPLFPAIVEHHLTAGFTYVVGNWDFDLALEHAFANSQTNTGAASTTNPFAGVEVEHYQNTVHFMVSYRF
jgi:long-chain fatty acid transport protein